MASLSGIKTIESLKNPAYRIFYFAMLAWWASMSIQMVGQSLLLYRLTNSAAILGVMALVTAMPHLLLSLYGGELADRFNKKNILLVTQGIAVLSALIVVFALSGGYLSAQHPGSWWILMVAALVQSIAMALNQPARQALIVELVGKEKLMNAAALNSLGINMFQFVIPIVGGVLIDKVGFIVIYGIMAGLFLLSMIFTSFISSPVTIAPVQNQNVVKNINDGLKYAWRNPVILLVIAFGFISTILLTPQITLMAIYADEILSVGATGLGILQSISGISALVISLIMATLPSKKRGLLLITSGLVSGIALIFFAFSRSMVLSCIIVAITGFATIINSLATMTLIQAYTQEAYLGRVLSIQMLGMGLGSLGGFVCGIMAENIGVQWSIGSFAMVLALVSFMALIFLPKIRNLD